MKLPSLFLDEKYFLDDEGKYSLSKKLKYYAFLPATSLTLYLATESALMIYISAFIMDSAYSKTIDMIKNTKNRKVESVENVATITSTPANNTQQ